MTPPAQVWRCPKCPFTYPSPAVVLEVKCPRHPTGRQPKMTVVEGEQAFRNRALPGRIALDNESSRATLATPPAQAEHLTGGARHG